MVGSDAPQALAAGMRSGRTRILEQAHSPLRVVANGWEFGPSEVGRFGTNYRYNVAFRRATLPPVRAFWSISLYDAMQNFVDNPLRRFHIGDRDDPVMDPDKSLAILVQHEAPASGVRNWLPAPTGAFRLTMRLYWPSDSILSGRRSPPLIHRVH